MVDQLREEMTLDRFNSNEWRLVLEAMGAWARVYTNRITDENGEPYPAGR